MTKYSINYENLKILSYNIYYKSMLGIDSKYFPQKEAHKNVANVLDNNYDIIGLQEVECLDKIFQDTLNRYNVVSGKSGPETLTTIIKKQYQVKKKEMTEFDSGRGILIILLNSKILLINIHAPHIYNDFGNYKGTKNKSQSKYELEFTRILNNKINNFLKLDEISRIIIMGDFNEAFNKVNSFDLIIKNKKFKMKTSSNKPLTCCNNNFVKANDLIYDSKYESNLYIPDVKEPASDHLPVATLLN